MLITFFITNLNLTWKYFKSALKLSTWVNVMYTILPIHETQLASMCSLIFILYVPYLILSHFRAPEWRIGMKFCVHSFYNPSLVIIKHLHGTPVSIKVDSFLCMSQICKELQRLVSYLISWLTENQPFRKLLVTTLKLVIMSHIHVFPSVGPENK